VAKSGTPNILCLVTDQHRADHLGCAGHPVVSTPNIDRIAESGVMFDRAYVANPLCMPARATLFTGRMPRGHGVRTNGIPLDPRVPTMTAALRRAGYHTHAAGKVHLGNFSPPQGLPAEDLRCEDWPESRVMWDSGRVRALPRPYYGLESADFVGGHSNWVWGDYVNWIAESHPEVLPAVRGEVKLEDWTALCGEPGFKSAVPAELGYNNWIADRTIDFLREQAERDAPFFCWTSFPDPHHSYVAPRPFCDMYDPGEIPLPTRREGELEELPPFFKEIHDRGTDRWRCMSGRFGSTARTDDELRHILALTFGMISCVDAAVGRILDAVTQLGLRDNTVICFLSDHGDMMGDHWMLNKGPFHFEGLLRIPLIWSWPGHIESGVRRAGLASQVDFAPTVLDLCGVPIPEGRVPPEPEASHQLRPWPGYSLRPMLHGDFRVREWAVVENDEDYLGTRVRTLVTERYKLTVYSGTDLGELFDLEQDPGELQNLWSDPAAQHLKNLLKAQLLDAYLEEESPLPRRMAHA
jgi:arylsulfatase A-like enzyme